MLSLFPRVTFGLVPISSGLALLKVWTGVGSSTFQRLALNPNGISNFLISEVHSSAIFGETHAVITPSQLLLLYLLKTSVIVSFEGSKLFFLIWIPKRTGLFNLTVTFDAMSISLPLETTSK